jgi:putative FmdB family regulatory protein
MPIYAYRCSACGHAKDVLQRMSDPLLSTCPACGGETFTKQLTAAGFQLKGSGWYVTDFKGGAAAPKSGDAAPASGEGKPEGKSEAKPEAKADAKSDGKAPGKADSAAPAAAPSPAPAAPAGGSGAGSGH